MCIYKTAAEVGFLGTNTDKVKYDSSSGGVGPLTECDP